MPMAPPASHPPPPPSSPMREDRETDAGSARQRRAKSASVSSSSKRCDPPSPAYMSPTGCPLPDAKKHNHANHAAVRDFCAGEILEVAVRPPAAKATSRGAQPLSERQKSFLTRNSDEGYSDEVKSRTPSPELEPRLAPSAKSSTMGGRWSPREDELLRAAVLEFGAKNWKKISKHAFGGCRSDVQCLHRWQKVLKPGLVKGPWTKEEDQVVIDLVLHYGVGNIKWSVIASQLPGRLGKQCRERWFNHLDPALKKGPWSEHEDRVLMEAQATMGNRWCQISQLLPGRSENAVKNRWNSAMRRKIQARCSDKDQAMQQLKAAVAAGAARAAEVSRAEAAAARAARNAAKGKGGERRARRGSGRSSSRASGGGENVDGTGDFVPDIMGVVNLTGAAGAAAASRGVAAWRARRNPTRREGALEISPDDIDPSIIRRSHPATASRGRAQFRGGGGGALGEGNVAFWPELVANGKDAMSLDSSVDARSANEALNGLQGADRGHRLRVDATSLLNDLSFLSMSMDDDNMRSPAAIESSPNTQVNTGSGALKSGQMKQSMPPPMGMAISGRRGNMVSSLPVGGPSHYAAKEGASFNPSLSLSPIPNIPISPSSNAIESSEGLVPVCNPAVLAQICAKWTRGAPLSLVPSNNTEHTVRPLPRRPDEKLAPVCAENKLSHSEPTPS